MATGNLGKLLRLEPGSGDRLVRIAGARFGGGGEVGPDFLARRRQGIALRTRSGNSARPDDTWSDWSEPAGAPAKIAIASPNARYIQWRAEFTGERRRRAGNRRRDVAYLPQNSPPVVRALVRSSASRPAAAATDAATPVGTIGHGGGQQIQVVWQADDPDGDKLVYSLYFRGEDETQWKLLRGNLTDTPVLDGRRRAGGRPVFLSRGRIRPAFESIGHGPGSGAGEHTCGDRQYAAGGDAERRGRTGASFQIFADAVDRGPLRRCEYSVDAGPWTPVEAYDGVTDSPQERFIIALPNLPAGEHLISVRVYDAAGNAGLAKYVAR